jgi:XTP/dITP diphosphohydrolase
MPIWFASGNLHKKEELAAILNSCGIAEKGGGFTLLLPQDAGLDFEPAETENSFQGNALLKARELYSLLEKSRPALYKTGDPVIADDSGICVDALGGRPGIYSARYAGAGTGTGVETASGIKLKAHERNALLLEELGNAPLRSARFVCAMVLFYSPARFFLAQETCEGEIVKNIDGAQGSGGFGYDPIFYLPDRGKTMAEISEEEKNTISHRGKAGRIIAAILKHITGAD